MDIKHLLKIGLALAAVGAIVLYGTQLVGKVGARTPLG